MNTLKTTFRSLRRNGVYTAVNIVGLAVSLTAAIFILLWVQDELSRNKCFDKAEQIYLYSYVAEKEPACFTIFPDISQICVTGNSEIELGVLSREYGEKFTTSDIYFADSAMFSFFNIKFLSGNAQQPFEGKNSIVLTESFAKQIFKDEEPVGKLINSHIYGIFYVTAVVADFPKNSSFNSYKGFLPVSFYPDWKDWQNRIATQVGSSRLDFNIYVRVAKNTDIKDLAINIWKERYPKRAFSFDPETDYYSKLIPIIDMHLYNYYKDEPSGIKKVKLFSSIILVLLLIAVINYVNLVTARLIDRAKEVEIRKILGESKFGLFMHMMRETMVMVFIALLMATIFIKLLLPFYNDLIGKQLEFSFANLEVWAIYSGMFVVVSLSAGIYPAMRLISFKPTGLSSFHQTVRQKFILRRILIVVQFTFTLIFITVATVMNLQMRFMKEKDPGFIKENIFYVPLHNMIDRYDAVKQELLRENCIAEVTAINGKIAPVKWEIAYSFANEEGESVMFTSAFLCGDYNVLDFFKIPILRGSGFTPDSEPMYEAILNEKALKEMKIDDPVNAPVQVYYAKKIIGEVSDYHHSSYHREIGNLLIMYNPIDVTHLYIKSYPGMQQEAIATVEKVWKQYNDGYPYNYRFIDDDFEVMYKPDIQKEWLFNIFAFIAIFVSCLGLFGLITYTTETKTKEIGLRKVHGASIKDIITMLTKEFLILVGISMFIAFPLAYFWLTKMLQDYAYRISLSWWMFAVAAIITVLLTALTVGFKALRAATANPVKAISKSE
jgi:ABC-type antimicrobial peptide transport system permease subunit